MKRLWQICFVAGFLFLLIGCRQKDEMAELKDGHKLLLDCVRLMDQFPSGEISKELWPKSVRDLKPIRVTRERDNIRILVKQESGKYTVGYDVFADPRKSPSAQGVWVQKTKVKGIYIFKLQY
ncbi:MAG: hypothetical protein ACK4UN_06860 [Limisphaerales bacterium]